MVNQTYFCGCEIKNTLSFKYTVIRLTNIKDSLKSVLVRMLAGVVNLDIPRIISVDLLYWIKLKS